MAHPPEPSGVQIKDHAHNGHQVRRLQRRSGVLARADAQRVDVLAHAVHRAHDVHLRELGRVVVLPREVCEMPEPGAERAMQVFLARRGLERGRDAPAVRMPDDEDVRYLEDLHREFDCGRRVWVVRGELAVVRWAA